MTSYAYDELTPRAQENAVANYGEEQIVQEMVEELKESNDTKPSPFSNATVSSKNNKKPLEPSHLISMKQHVSITIDHNASTKNRYIEACATRLFMQKQREGVYGHVKACEKHGRISSETRADGKIRSVYSFSFTI